MKRLHTILLVDDDAPTLFLNKLVIEDLDCTDRVLTAENGRQAIDMLTEKIDDEFLCPDLILLDINMPIINGWEFMDKYQTLSAEQKAKIVVVMVTTSLNPDDRSRAESIEDIKDFVSKPLDEITLKDIIEKHFN
ncbi:MAG: response regulator [Saprospirales bacterium]|nr:response regulator [Saprospirales bacterium]|tara:strand:- start:28 stop:432 length:405 start_codon:yes stop_codon:yes gene_type:complete